MPFIERQSGLWSVLLQDGQLAPLVAAPLAAARRPRQHAADQRRAREQRESVVRRDGEADCVKMEGEVGRGGEWGGWRCSDH